MSDEEWNRMAFSLCGPCVLRVSVVRITNTKKGWRRELPNMSQPLTETAFCDLALARYDFPNH